MTDSKQLPVFYTVVVLVNSDWNLTLPHDNVIDALKEVKSIKREGRYAIVIKTNSLEKLANARILMQQYRKVKPKKAMLDFTAEGIAKARFQTNREIKLRLSNY